MKSILQLFLFIGFILPIQTKASPLMGAEVYYHYLGGLKYEITFRVFRDCRGTPLDTALQSEMQGISGSNILTKKLSLTRISITDLSTVCKKVNKPCSPPNTAISSTDPAIEEHIYKDTVDFNTTDTSFKKCCIIKFGIGQCCRQTGTLYGSGTDFWVWSELDICQAKNNNSPIFSSIPNNIICCNQEYYSNLGGNDTVDFDSLSYSYVSPMENWTKSISYPNFNNWITAYYPSGFDRSKSYPYMDPPIGIYFDEWDGSVIVTPTGCPEKTFVSFKISEWRKDSTGKYKKIGEVRRDIQYIVQQCTNNNPPILAGPYEYEVCAAKEICFTVVSDDKQFIPPPPTKPNPPDSTKLTWNKGIGRGATFTIVNTSARLQKGKFCWTPKESDARDMPYTFTVTARDVNCPMNAVSTKTYSVKVKPIYKTEMFTKQLAINKITLESKPIKPYPANPTYLWQVADSVNNPLNIDYYFFKSSKSISSNRAFDTLIFRKEGMYIIRHQFNNPVYNCPTLYFDTIRIPEVMDVSISKTYDTLICMGTPLKFMAKVSFGTAPFLYKWGNDKPDTISLKTVVTYKDTLIELAVTDSKGLTAYSFCKIRVDGKINLTAGDDIWICKNDTAILQPIASNFGDTCYWEWYFGGQKMSDKPIFKVGKGGQYIVKVTDGKKCYSKNDTIKVSTLEVIVDAGKNQEICIGATVKLKANETTIHKYKRFEWYEIKNSASFILISYADSAIAKPDNPTNYLAKIFVYEGGRECYATDTVNVSFKKVEFKKGEVCQNKNELDLHSIIIKPVNSFEGNFTWKLDKTLARPSGSMNTLNQLLYDKDGSFQYSHYFLRVGKSTIDLKGKDMDSIKLFLDYDDDAGCKYTTSLSATIIIRNNIELTTGKNEVSRCYGDSIISISDKFGVNYNGGKWFTNNDSSQYLQWPQGNNVLLNENVKTINLNPLGGKYLLKYIYDNNSCQSFIFAHIKLEKAPVLNWTQTIIGDSIIITDISTNTDNREWYINSAMAGSLPSIKLSIEDAKTNEILLKLYNINCSKENIIHPFTNSASHPILMDITDIYPNPTKGKINIEINKAGNYTCKLYSIEGKLVFEKAVKGLQTQTLNLKLSQGIYTLVIYDDLGNSTRKKIMVE